MKVHKVVGIVAVTGSLLLAGCASTVTTADQYSGFLPSYSDLKETTSASGVPVLRWVDPNFRPSQYKAIVYEPVTYYPKVQPSNQISQQALDGVLNYTNTKLKAAAEQRLPLVTQPGPGVLIFRGAITGVNTSNRNLKPYEYIPVALVLAGTRAAIGTRAQDTNFYFEGELLDGVTKKPVLKVVRKGQGTEVDNTSQQVTLNDLKTVIDNLAMDAVMFNTPKK